MTNLKRLAFQVGGGALLLPSILSLLTIGSGAIVAIFGALLFGIPGGFLLYKSTGMYKEGPDIADVVVNAVIGLLTSLLVGISALSINRPDAILFACILYALIAGGLYYLNAERRSEELNPAAAA